MRGQKNSFMKQKVIARQITEEIFKLYQKSQEFQNEIHRT